MLYQLIVMQELLVVLYGTCLCWCMSCYGAMIGGSRGRAGCTVLPMGPNSFVFAYIFTEKCLRRRFTPPLTGARPLREILDPSLAISINLLGNRAELTIAKFMVSVERVHHSCF